MKIVIADDRKHTRHSLKVLVSTCLQDVEIEEAATGLEAERLATESGPDLVLMDIQMPERNGIEATRLIKARRPDIRILVLSLYAEREAEALDAGADAFVSKDGAPDLLISTIHMLLEDQSEASDECRSTPRRL